MTCPHDDRADPTLAPPLTIRPRLKGGRHRATGSSGRRAAPFLTAAVSPVRTYDTYLSLGTLPAVQPVTPSPAEPAFITTHQTMEIWFRQQLHDLTRARASLMAGELPAAARELGRCQAITTLLTEHLRSMPLLVEPEEFAEFRGALDGGSGAQSTRFREIEALSGLASPRTARLHSGASVWDAFLAACRRDFGELSDAPDGPALERVLAQSPELSMVAAALLAHDLAWALWRTEHAVLAQTMIGHQAGTGGSTGVEYLKKRAELRFYPDLWAASGQLPAGAAQAAGPHL